MDHIIGLGEVEAKSARLQADEEDWHIALLEILDRSGAFAGGLAAVKVFVCDAFLFQGCRNDGQEFHELTEYQNFMAIFQHLLQEGHEGFELGAGKVRSAIDNTGKVILQDHLKHCIVDAAREGDQQAIDDLCKAIEKYMK